MIPTAPQSSKRVLLFDDQRTAGTRRAERLRSELGVDVRYVWDVEQTIDEILLSRYDLCVLDYSDVRGWGDTRCGLDIVKRGISESTINRDTPVMIYTMFTIRPDEIDELEHYGRIVEVKNQVLGMEGIVEAVAHWLDLPWTRSEIVTSRVWGVGEIQDWSETERQATVIVPSWSDSTELVVEWSWLGQELVEELSVLIGELEGGVSEANPLLVRVEYNENALRSYELDLRVLDRIGPAAAFRSSVTWTSAPERIDPEEPTDTPAGKRAAGKVPAAEVWESLHEEWVNLASTAGGEEGD